MHAKHIRRDNRLHIHDMPNIDRTRQNLLSLLLDIHDIKKMRRRDHHIHNIPPRLPLHAVVAKDAMKLDVHYLVCIIEIIVLN